MKLFLPSVVLLLLCACTSPKVANTLVCADSLLSCNSSQQAFDTLKSINPSSLWWGRDNAYYVLLYTQAQYKTFDSIEDDSLINIAVRYYRDGHDLEKLTRSYLYKGAVLGEMGLRREAINWYKEAEQVAVSTDYLTLGLINTRLAELYDKSYIENGEDIERYKTALGYYRKANHKPFENATLSRLAICYTNTNRDSAYYYIYKSINLSKQWRHPIRQEYDIHILAAIHEYYKNYQAVIDIYNSQELRNSTDPYLYRFVIRSYANLGKIDSAEMYLKYIEPKDAKQRVSYLMTLEDIALAKGDYKNAHTYCNVANKLADSIVDASRSDNLFLIEKRFDNNYLKDVNSNLRNVNTTQKLLIILALAVIIALCIIAYFIKLNSRRVREQQLQFILHLQTELELQQYKTAETNNSAKGLAKDIIEGRTQMIKEILTIAYLHGGNGERFIKFFNKYLESNRQSQKASENILACANQINNNVIDYIKSQYPTLTDTDLLLFSLTCLDFSAAEMCVYMGYSTINVLSVSRTRLMRSRIGRSIPITVFLKECIEENNRCNLPAD